MAYSVDDAGNVLAVNRRWLEAMEYRKSDILGRGAGFFMTPESADRMDTEFLPELREEGILRDTAMRFVTRNGDVLDVAVEANRTDTPEGPVYLFVVRDVGEQRKIERKLREGERMYRRFVQLIPDAVLLHSKGVVLFANQAAATLLGRDRPQNLEGEHFANLVDPTWVERNRHHVAILQDNIEYFPATEMTILRMDQTPLDVEIINIPVEENGRKAGLSVIHNHTERNLLQQQLFQAERSIDLERMMAELATNLEKPASFISFNLPGIREFLEAVTPLLDRRAEDGEQAVFQIDGIPYGLYRTKIHRLLGIMEESAGKLAAIVKDLKKRTKHSSTKRTGPLDVRRLIDRALLLADSRIRKTFPVVDRNFEPDLPEVIADGERMERVLVWLFLDAAESVSSQEIRRIQVRAFRSYTHAGTVEISVEHDGRRKKPEFTGDSGGREPASPWDSGGISGLGNIDAIVREQGGWIDEAREVIGGSTLRIFLPMAPENLRTGDRHDRLDTAG